MGWLALLTHFHHHHSQLGLLDLSQLHSRALRCRPGSGSLLQCACCCCSAAGWRCLSRGKGRGMQAPACNAGFQAPFAPGSSTNPAFTACSALRGHCHLLTGAELEQEVCCLPGSWSWDALRKPGGITTGPSPSSAEYPVLLLQSCRDSPRGPLSMPRRWGGSKSPVCPQKSCRLLDCFPLLLLARSSCAAWG